MIVGNGDIASVLKNHPDRLYFASGVSNSRETRESEYEREKKLLLKQNRKARLVYFSSLAIFYGKGRYVQHKKEMESLIKQEFPRHAILRLGNITWGTNPRTLINYLRAHPKAQIRDEFRFIIDKDEFLFWLGLIPNWNVEMNVTGKRMKVKDIYDEYCHVGLRTK